MLSRSGRTVFLAACSVAVGPWLVSPVFADPIRVTSGHTNGIELSAATDAVLIGDGLRLQGFGTISATAPLHPGDTATLDGQFSYGPNVQLFDVMVNGQAYRATLSGLLTFTTQPFVAPPPSNGGQAFFNTTFTMRGHVVGLSGAGSGAQQLFSVDVFGSGNATSTAFLVNNSVFLPTLTTISYNFTSDAVSPTPEPASLLLLGTGAAGLIARSRRRF